MDSNKEHLLILAPMYNVTDMVFRQIIAACAPPDVFITEFVNVDGLQSAGRSKLFTLSLFGRDRYSRLGSDLGFETSKLLRNRPRIS